MTDLIIIGAGPGGYKAAIYAAQHNLKVIIFEEGHVGGTCLNVGCIPTKTYVHAASFAEAVERQSVVVEQLRTGIETLLSHPNITLIRERASFVDARTVETPSGQRYSADHIIIATGSSAKMLPIAGIDDPRVVTSTGLLALKELPRRLCIVGAGVIGMEFASVFRRFGSEVTVIEFLKECLPMVESDIAKRLRKQMEKQGITFHMQCAVQRIANGQVIFENKKRQEESVEADVVLMATGRKPNTEGLNLEALGITLAPGGAIPVGEHFEVGQKGLFAIGDVNGRQMLAHAAEFQGHHVVNRILGREDGIRFDVMPAAVFTTPEVACVGPAEEQLKAEGRDIIVHKATFRANGRALCIGETEGLVKLITDADDRLLAAHVMGPHAADLVQEVTAYITLGATLQQLRETVHIHPTVSEVLMEVS